MWERCRTGRLAGPPQRDDGVDPVQVGHLVQAARAYSEQEHGVLASALIRLITSHPYSRDELPDLEPPFEGSRVELDTTVDSARSVQWESAEPSARRSPRSSVWVREGTSSPPGTGLDNA